jgi:hypothetical protein
MESSFRGRKSHATQNVMAAIDFDLRAFGPLKRRFKILDDVKPFFPFATQVDIMIACCIIKNWIIQEGDDEFIIEESNGWLNHSHAISSSDQASEHAFMVN